MSCQCNSRGHASTQRIHHPPTCMRLREDHRRFGRKYHSKRIDGAKFSWHSRTVSLKRDSNFHARCGVSYRFRHITVCFSLTHFRLHQSLRSVSHNIIANSHSPLPLCLITPVWQHHVQHTRRRYHALQKHRQHAVGNLPGQQPTNPHYTITSPFDTCCRFFQQLHFTHNHAPTATSDQHRFCNGEPDAPQTRIQPETNTITYTGRITVMLSS